MSASLVTGCSGLFMRARYTQTDQTTTLCVQEVEIYLERWEVLGALVVLSLIHI